MRIKRRRKIRKGVVGRERKIVIERNEMEKTRGRIKT